MPTTIRALTDEMIGAMHQDLDAVGIQKPTHEPRATEYVRQMVGLIDTLRDKGLAYQAPNGDVNFAVRKLPGYGKLTFSDRDPHVIIMSDPIRFTKENIEQYDFGF